VLGLEAAAAPDATGRVGASRSLIEQVDAFERSLIEAALREAAGSITAAAAALELPRKTLHDKMKRLGLEAEAYRAV
jgi:two-component system C4-dicarboxylate transport response regulator DctD